MRLMLAIALTGSLTGCASLTNTFGTEEQTVCAVWKPITYSRRDTDETIVQVRVNNARRDAWCRDR